MADVPLGIKDVIGNSDLTSAISPALSSILNPLMPLIQAIGIATLVYVIFLIIKTILNIGQSLRMRKIANSVVQINDKMDLLLEKFPAKKEKIKSKK